MFAWSLAKLVRQFFFKQQRVKISIRFQQVVFRATCNVHKWQDPNLSAGISLNNLKISLSLRVLLSSGP